VNSFHLFLDHAKDYWPVLAAIIASIPGILALRNARRKQDVELGVLVHSEGANLAAKWQEITEKSTLRNNMLQDRIGSLEQEVKRLKLGAEAAEREHALKLKIQEDLIEELKGQIVGLQIDIKNLKQQHGDKLSAEIIRANIAERKLEFCRSNKPSP
jgi:TolA-binding protein